MHFSLKILTFGGNDQNAGFCIKSIQKHFRGSQPQTPAAGGEICSCPPTKCWCPSASSRLATALVDSVRHSGGPPFRRSARVNRNLTLTLIPGMADPWNGGPPEWWAGTPWSRVKGSDPVPYLSGEHYGLLNGVWGGSPTDQRFSTIFSTQNGLS